MTFMNKDIEMLVNGYTIGIDTTPMISTTTSSIKEQLPVNGIATTYANLAAKSTHFKELFLKFPNIVEYGFPSRAITDRLELKKKFSEILGCEPAYEEIDLKDSDSAETFAAKPGETVWNFPDGCVILSRNKTATVEFVTYPGNKLVLKLAEVWKSMTTNEAESTSGKVFMLMMNQNGPVFQALEKKLESEYIPENYTEEVLHSFERIKKELNSERPKGRIAIIQGEPGTGKTHLLKALVTDPGMQTLFVFVNPNDLVHLAGPSFLHALLAFIEEWGGKSITFLVEDADICLTPRDGFNMPIVSGVLNLGDGILGQLLDIRIIFTTNAKIEQFDAAITRAGRLSELLTVGPLDPEQASSIYKRLTGTEIAFTKKQTLAEVYQKAFDSERKEVQNKQKAKIGF